MPEPMPAPTGDVCLVFTDVQGSTQLWEADAAAMAAGLRLHNALLRSLIRDHHGYEVKTEGDAFMVAFAEADDAVQWCLSAQLALQAAPWSQALLALPGAAPAAGFRGLRVRMGAHKGAPACVSDPVTGRMDYFGPVVNRAARVGGCGHGGQVVVSQAVFEACEAARGADSPAVWTALGAHGLRGLREPETLHGVAPAALADRRFPPLRTDTARRSNLPAPSGALIGRNASLHAVAAATERCAALITLVGPAGVGKTRLALHIAHEREASGPAGGTWWVDLSHVHSESAVVRAVAEAVALPLPEGSDRARALGRALQLRGHTELFVDNAEQVIDGVRALARALQETAPALRMVVTSRARLDVAGEVVLTVAGLPQEAALELLETRARAVAPGFRLQKGDRERAIQLVRQLDGWPLAIELAAARLGALPLQRVLDRMDQRFRLLARRGAQGRQATLEAAIAWSWDLLSEEARVVLAGLTVFQAPVHFTAAEAVLSAAPSAPWVDEALEELLRHSLLRRQEDARGGAVFDLYVSVRAFAELQRSAVLGEEGLDRLQSAHADWASRFGILGRQWVGGTTAAGELGAEVVAHRGDLQSALEWALAARKVPLAAELALGLAHIALYQGPVAEGREPLERVLRQPIIPSEAAVELRLCLGMVCSRMGEAETALMVLEPEALGTASEADHALRIALSRFDICRRLGRMQDCQALSQQCLDQLAPATPPALAGHVHNQAGILASHQARYSDAEAHYRKAQQLYARAGLERHRAKVALNLGGDLATRGRLEEARSQLDAALEGARQSHDRRFQCYASLNIGHFEHLHGQESRAWELAVEGEHIAQDIGDLFALASARLNQGRCLRAQGRALEAELALRDAVERLGGIQSGYWLAVARYELALQRIRVGDLSEAEQLLGASRGFLQAAEDPGALARLAYGEGRLLLGRGQLPEAEAQLLEARQLCLATEQVLESVSSLVALARLRWRQGDTAGARQRYHQATVEAEHAWLWKEWAGAQNNLGILEAQEGQPARAEAHFRAAVARCRRSGARQTLAISLANLAECLLAQERDPVEIHAILDEAAQIDSELGFRDRVGGLRRTQALVALREGALPRARAYARRAVEDAAAVGRTSVEVESLALWSRIAGMEGAEAQAGTLAERARARAASAGLLAHPGVVRALAELEPTVAPR